MATAASSAKNRPIAKNRSLARSPEHRARDAAAPAAPADPADARVEALVRELIGRVADKWTMLVLDLLAEEGEMRFTQISRRIGTISQKMLTQTLRGMERDGLVVRTVHPVVPPRVEYRLTELGRSLGAAFCGVWIWAEQNLDAINNARRAFDGGAGGGASAQSRA